MDLIALFLKVKEQSLFGRYITNNHIEPLLKNLTLDFNASEIGKSVNNNSIYSVEVGTGPKKILMWSQMHGNESTTTKALFDLFNFLKFDISEAQNFKKEYTLLCIPILNPDGAQSYTRENASNIDLNRDAINLSQPESCILTEVFNSFKPDFCFNLHDQRSIYAAGNTKNPATVSFLSPAFNDARDINAVREKAIVVIVAMNNELQKHIPNQIGRFDDTFNANCVGDTFQSLGVPTILFEGGHFPMDYQREETRKYLFIALFTALTSINENDVVPSKIAEYMNIPQNIPHFYDFIYKKIKINDNSSKKIITFAAHYDEILSKNEILFEANFVAIEGCENAFGHVEYDGNESIYSDNNSNFPDIGKKANFYLNNNIKFVNGLIEMQ